jgi:hypothetical protein
MEVSLGMGKSGATMQRLAGYGAAPAGCKAEDTKLGLLAAVHARGFCVDSLIQQLNLATRAGLDFIMIGGHAIVGHGLPRTTFDVDLMVRFSDRAAWREILEEGGWNLYHGTPSFLQWQPPGEATMPLDLMLTDEATFDKVAAASHEITLLDTPIRIPSPEHLLAMKLHAAHQRAAERDRDWWDILALLDSGKLDLESPRIAAIIERYADAAGKDRIRTHLARRRAGG